MKSINVFFLASVVLTLTLIPAFLLAEETEKVEKSSPAPGKFFLDADGKMQLSPEDRCPVCAMVILDHPKFTSAISLKNKKTFYFCGTGCMLKTWLHPEMILKVNKDDIDKIITREYFTGEEVDGSKVTWIAGSDVVGPMGKAIVPVLGDEGLESFKKRHGGKITFKLAELTDDLWKKIKKK